MNSPPRPPNSDELTGLVACLIRDRHPAMVRFETVTQVLEFLFDQCTVAVFDGYSDTEESPSGSVVFLVMDDGPESVAVGRLDPGSSLRLSYATLGDFAPYEAPSRHGVKATEVLALTREPRVAHAGDIADFLRMFRATADPFLLDSFRTDTERGDYLRDRARLAVLDHIRSGPYEGPLAFFLWPAGPRFVTVAIRTNRRWRFASTEIPE